MVRLAISPHSRLEVSRTELRRSGTSFTYHTVAEMRRRFPNRPLIFIIGADTIPELPTWHRYRELLQMIRFVAVSRPGYARVVANGIEKRLTVLRVKGLRASSTAIRKAIARGSRSPGLPPTVAAFIRRHGLYQEN